MLSRVAQRIYWLSRYLERAEDSARLILVRHHSILDLPRSVQPGWGLLLDVLGAHEDFAGKRRAANENNIISYVFSDRDNPSSIISSLTAARENMRTTREVLPSETWERVNSLYLSVARRSNKTLPRGSRHNVLNNIVQSCQQITGMDLVADAYIQCHQLAIFFKAEAGFRDCYQLTGTTGRNCQVS